MINYHMAPKSKITPTKCPLCEFNSKRITTVDKHIVIEHNMQPKEAYDATNGAVMCACKCGKETQFINVKKGYSRLLKGHNANIYKLYDENKAKEISEKRKQKLRGRTSWSKGLTKETDKRVAKRGEATSKGRKKAFDEGKITAWSKGLTKETDARIKKNADLLKQKYADGTHIPWAKGLTKESDPRVQMMATKVSITHTKQGIRSRLDTAKRLNLETIRSRIEKNSTLRVNDVGEYKSDASSTINVTCATCNSSFFSSLRKLQYGRCWTCDPNGSKAQTDIANFIKQLNIRIETNHRDIIKGQHRMAELDIYVPEKKFAIEYNGLYWHSEIHKSNSYHENKSQQCKERNIRLMHVFQDEWNENPEIIKSMIKNRLGLTEIKINARQCLVRTLTQKEKKAFFVSNHIDGDTPSTTTIGLIHDNVIVGALSLRRPFHKKYKDSMEIGRMCTLNNSNVRGGLSKLSKHAKLWCKNNGYLKIISYVDTRHGSPNWTQAGFKLIGETSSRFWWTDCHKRFNRFKFRADKTRGMTEAQVAEEAKVIKIWGCKNLIYQLVVT